MILCCGEALVDMIPDTTASGQQGFVPHNGGAVFNTAVALGRLGAPVGLLTGMSSDLFGQQLRRGLDDAGVDAGFVVTSDRPTTLAFVHLVDGHARYVFYDENSAGRILTPEDMPRLPEAVTALYFGGISLACEPGADAYAALLQREGEGRAVMLDPNIRPGFIEDADRYRARLDRMMAQTDILKVSDDDLHWMRPGDDPIEAKARALRGSGPGVVILTRGADGATAFMADAEVHVPAQPVTVVDTVGAGDTFNAGVLAHLADLGVLTKGLPDVTPDVMRDALQFGARVSAVTVSRAGANPPWRAELT